eukprot:CAMPEP_0119146162 /NCGR_PEP_ID=MMETSP1310-20130426/38487_1 /TAXON_ID=464262 /ORGANISM="Genus nov. species nov., Strain RCC2339" /LENGTH=523 /DNA_ID=CAMNT_0007138029 /DNA_START=60 /DNA_END=1632 /DNA_ORIENTATION=-
MVWALWRRPVESTPPGSAVDGCDLPLHQKCLPRFDLNYTCAHGKWKSGPGRTVAKVQDGLIKAEVEDEESETEADGKEKKGGLDSQPSFEDMDDEVDDMRYTVFVPEVLTVLDSMEKKKKIKKKKKCARVMKLGNLQNVRDQLCDLLEKEDELNKPDKDQRKDTLRALISRIDSLADKYKDREFYINDKGEKQKLPSPEMIEKEVDLAMEELNATEAFLLPEMDIVAEEDNGAEITCPICWDDCKVSQMKSMGCGHLHCKGCLQDHVGTLISNGQVKDIRCPDPNCEIEVTPDIIKAVVDMNLYRKYVDFSVLQDLRENPNARWCPVKECSMAVVCDPDVIAKDCKVVCPACKFVYCFHCRRMYHGHSRDEEACPEPALAEDDPDAKFFQYIKNKETAVKPCPRCKMSTEKNDGCNTMTCPSCSANWCWLCSEIIYDESALPSHFREGRCKGKQFANADSIEEAEHMENLRREWIKRHKVRYYGGRVVRGILLLPIICIGGLLLLVIGAVVIIIAVPLVLLFR